MTTIVTRQGKGSPLSWVEADANFTNLNTDKAENSVVALKAPLASPDLTGVPTAPTATNGTNTTQLATTAFVQAKTASQTPSTAFGNIAATTVQAALEELDTEKASLTGATFSGQVTATKLQTGVSGTNTNNFILDASAADGTMKLERGDGQDIMTVDAAGKVAFPQNIIPALRVVAGASTLVPTGTFTRILLDSEEFDTNNNFANNRFTPTVAGYYSVTGQVIWGGTTPGNGLCAIYKNGAAVSHSAYVALLTAGLIQNTATLVYCNGSTDYIELWATQTSAGALNVLATNTNLTAVLVRAA